MGKDRHVMLDNRSVLPPAPLFPGGDCGACCLSSVLGISHQAVYDAKGKVEPIHCYEVPQLCDAFGLRYDDRMPPMERHSKFYYRQMGAFGFPAYSNSIRWWDRMKRFLNRGWVGMASVAINRDGHITTHTDHWVLIVGYRESWKDILDADGKRMGASREDTVIVSCSRAGVYEEPRKEFLQFRGGYNAIYIEQRKKS